jgi:hypothetical protein
VFNDIRELKEYISPDFLALMLMRYLNGCPDAEVNNEIYFIVNVLFSLSLFWNILLT